MFSRETIYVHYGSSSFDMNRFENVQNSDMLSKPINGGLWASPEKAEEGWQKINSIRPQDKSFFKFKLDETAKVLLLNNKESLEKLPTICSKSEKFPIILNFEMLSGEYDAIFYQLNKETDEILPCWDCDCLLVMNPNVINVLE